MPTRVRAKMPASRYGPARRQTEIRRREQTMVAARCFVLNEGSYRLLDVLRAGGIHCGVGGGFGVGGHNREAELSALVCVRVCVYV